MPGTIKNADKRVIVFKMLLELMHVICAAYFQKKRLAACADDIALLSAIFVGQAERRPLNPSKLSDLAGMARPTVIRKLERMELAGLVERYGNGGFRLRHEVTNEPSVLMAAAECRKIIVKGAARLSKLDT